MVGAGRQTDSGGKITFQSVLSCLRVRLCGVVFVVATSQFSVSTFCRKGLIDYPLPPFSTPEQLALKCTRIWNYKKRYYLKRHANQAKIFFEERFKSGRCHNATLCENAMQKQTLKERFKSRCYRRATACENAMNHGRCQKTDSVRE